MNELFDLCRQVGVSGFEFDLSGKVKELLEPVCHRVETDLLGNVIGLIDNKQEKTVLLEAHLDEIGLMVQHIDDNGFVRFAAIGGIDPSILPACEVTIHGQRPVFGVIGAKPPHLQTKEEGDKAYQIKDLFIDVGYSKQELEQLVQVGDAISFCAPPQALEGGCFASKSVDNRMGVYVVAQCLKRLKDKNLGCNVAALCAVQEEVGCRGAQVGAYRINPDCAVVIDVTHGTSPYVTGDEGFPLGGGPAIGVGPNLDRRLTHRLTDCARQHNIPYCLEPCPGNSGTDAWPIQVSRSGIPCMLVSVPIRYMHTTAETAQQADIQAAIHLICTMIEGGDFHC